MRIEYQGTIEARPVFQHVGYISSACTGTRTSTGMAGLGLALFTLGSVLALVTARRAPRLSRGALILLGVLAAGMVAAGPVLFERRTHSYVRYYHSPDIMTE